MIKIKFRAKIKPGYEGFGYKAGDWFYWTIKDKFTMQEMLDWETLGQYTGRKDKNSKEIYGGDVVKVPLNGVEKDILIREIVWRFSGFYIPVSGGGDFIALHKYTPKQCEIIGNIYENPELLQESS